MDPLPWMLIGAVAAGAAAWMALVQASGVLLRRVELVDVGWALGVGGVALAFAVCGEGAVWRRVLVAALAGAWSLRLGGYLLRNRVLRGDADGRYGAMIAAWGGRFGWRWALFHQAQALLIVLFALPLLPIVFDDTAAFQVWDALALAIWVVAVGGEALADAQLARWRAVPEHRGRTCRSGLWRYSRHPNYFFEWLHWWTYVALGFGAPWWPLSWIGPAVMLAFLYRVTGIPYAEAQALRSRGEDYARYQRETSAFFPWFSGQRE